MPTSPRYIGGRRFRRTSLLLLAFLGSHAVLSSAAAESPTSAPSTSAIDTLVERAWNDDPTLRATGLSARAQQQRADAARRERGEIQIDAGVGLMTMGDHMGPTWMLSASAGTEFRPRVLNQAEEAAAYARSETLECSSVVRAITLREQVETLVLAAAILEQESALLDREQELIGSLQTVIAAQRQGGLSVTALALRVETRLAAIESERFALDSRRQDLQAAWRQRVVDGNLEDLAIEAAWFEHAPTNLDTVNASNAQALQLQRDAQELHAERSIEEASRRIRWRIGGSYGRSAMMTSPMDMVPSHTLMAQVGVAIPRVGAANGRMAALQAEVDALNAQQDQSARDIEQQWTTLQSQHHQLMQQQDNLQRRVQPLEKALIADFERQLRSGQQAWGNYLDALIATIELQRTSLTQQATLQALRITMDALSDGQLSGRPPLLSQCGASTTQEASR